MSNITTAPAATGEAPLLERLKHGERLALLLGIGLQFAVLLVMIGLALRPHFQGERILLRVVPVDPRDLLRGDYITLGYEFTRAPLSLPSGEVLQPGGDVFISLEPEADGQHYRPSGYSRHRPSTGKYLKGRLTAGNRIECGIESYYVQEGKGLAYEDAARRRHLTAEILLTPDGQAQIVGVKIDSLTAATAMTGPF